MIDFISPFLPWIGMALLALLSWFGITQWGRKKKAEGVAEEKEESRVEVQEVETKMKRKIAKPRTTSETRDRLDEGTF